MANQVLDFMESIENKDKKLKKFVEDKEALSQFVTDYGFLKSNLGLSQREVATRMGNYQSVVSKIESLKGSPSYRTLAKISRAVGGELFLTPMKDMVAQVPYDLMGKVRELSKKCNKTTEEYLNSMLRTSIEKEIIKEKMKNGEIKVGNNASNQSKKETY